MAIGILAGVPAEETRAGVSFPISAAQARDEASEPGIEAVYRANYDLMRFVAGRKFNVPSDDVRPLIHEVFVAYIQYRDRVRDDRAWLVAATCNACRDYWQARGRRDAGFAEGGIERTAEPADLARRMDLCSVLSDLRPRDREVLRLRFVEGYTPRELAARLATTVPYAKKLVHKSVARARRLVEARAGVHR
jgi:RNA polymerase sigma factor (sigma-70 family)